MGLTALYKNTPSDMCGVINACGIFSLLFLPIFRSITWKVVKSPNFPYTFFLVLLD